MSTSAATRPAPIARAMSNLSFQLPDLVALTSSFPFRINKNCKLATDKSEAWLLGTGSPEFEPPVLLEEEKEVLPSVKHGLLASLCAPAADAPQLQILADFWSLVVLSHSRILREARGHGWPTEIEVDAAEDGLELLGSHELLKSVVPSLTRALSSRSHDGQLRWKRQFTRSVQAFAASQLQLSSSLQAEAVPTLPEFISLRRDTYASSMYLDLLDLFEITSRPYGCSLKDDERIERITMLAMYVTGWILDIFSFASGPGIAPLTAMPTHTPTHNLVSLLTTHRNLSVQGAMNYAGGMVKEALEEIQRLERELLPNSASSSGTNEGSGWSDWLGSGLGMVKSAVGMGDTQSTLTKSKFLADVPLDWEGRFSADEDIGQGQSPDQRAAETARCIRAMKDWIVGTVHWGYESELYFGQKGDEVRSFGWVFLNGGDSGVQRGS
ncbi:hypothetical protein FA13DRAFT_1781202 [Coprinellus micaceus]|uniref:Terpenoid synthase n=1 Tax=Coprinellus micaceus TaxID=71717 RepID=A0A4Y7SAP0_COPMI|nr:hypothetical protein FA13DRAFT_1781202 [Coprinellus micaceus]